MLKLRLSNIRLDPKIVWAIASIGLSPFFIQVASSAVAFFVNNRLKLYGGNTAIEAFAIDNTLVMIIVMVMVGLTQGMQPIVGYNYGAKKMQRVNDTLVYTIKIGVGIGCIGFVLGVFFPQIFVKTFNPSPELATTSANALRIITCMLPLVGYQIVVTNFFQCIGMASKSIFLSLTRQFIFLIPLLFILPPIFNLNGVWAALPTADFLSTILTTIMISWQMNKFRKI